MRSLKTTALLISIILIAGSALASTPEEDAHADALLAALQANSGAGILARANIVGTRIPTSGGRDMVPTYAYAEWYGMLYNSDGVTHSLAWDDPTTYTSNMIHASTLLNALRANSAAGCTNLYNLVGQYVPTSGLLAGAQVDTLFSLMFYADGTHTQAWTSPTDYCTGLQHATALLTALRASSGAGLTYLNTITGKTLPLSGFLSGTQVDTLYGLMYNADGTTNTAWSDPTTYVSEMGHAYNLLVALRANSGAGLGYLSALTGSTIPSSGALSAAQIGELYSLMYNADGTVTTAYSNPTDFITGMQHATALLTALRASSGAGLTYLSTISGTTLPASGTLTAAQITALYGLMYNADGTTNTAWSNPAGYVTEMQHAYNLLVALRANSGAGLGYLSTLTGSTIPSSGALSAAQVQELYGLMYNADGTTNTAYSNPTDFITGMQHATALLTALRASSGAGLTYLSSLAGITIPSSGALTASQIEDLYGLMYNSDGTTGKGWSDPTGLVTMFQHAYDLLAALRADSGAGLANLEVVYGITLPLTGPLTSTQLEDLIGLMYNADGTTTDAYDDVAGFLTMLRILAPVTNPNDFIADFGTFGLWKYSSGSWSQLSGADVDSYMLTDVSNGTYDAIADFSAAGLWKYSSGSWTQLSGANTESFLLSKMASGSYDVIADFGSSGFWKYSGSTWSMLSAGDVEYFGLSGTYNSTYDAIADFGTGGLWKYSSSTWSQLSGANAESFVLSDVYNNSYDIITDFGSAGLWRYSGSSWTQLSAANAETYMLSGLNGGSYDVIADFGTSGLWRYSSSTWSQLSGGNADSFGLSDLYGGSYDVIADFGSSGFWKYSGSTWTMLSGANASGFMITSTHSGSYDVIADFGSAGLWKYSSSTWTNISSSSTRSFIITNSKTDGTYDIIADFGTSGIWKYSSGAWTQLSAAEVDPEVSQRLDVQNRLRIYGKSSEGGYSSTTQLVGAPTRPS
jgi:hypothetical protein